MKNMVGDLSEARAFKPPSIHIEHVAARKGSESTQIVCLLREDKGVIGVASTYVDQYFVVASGHTDSGIAVISVTIRNPGLLIKEMCLSDGHPILAHDLLIQAKQMVHPLKHGRDEALYDAAISALMRCNLPLLYVDWKAIVEERRQLDHESGAMLAALRSSIPPMAPSVISSAPPPQPMPTIPYVESSTPPRERLSSSSGLMRPPKPLVSPQSGSMRAAPPIAPPPRKRSGS